MAKKGLDLAWLRRITPKLETIIAALQQRYGVTQCWTTVFEFALSAEQLQRAQGDAQNHVS
jgi:hypothetical protein